MRYLCQMLFFLFWRVRVFGLRNVPAEGGVLLACNHQSFLDPVLVTLALHREGNYMARDTLFRNRWFRRLIESLNAFPVKRSTADVGAIKEIIRRLRDGKVVVTFPEGTRTADGSIRPLHDGSMLVAKRAGAAVVPTLIDGAFEAWPRTRSLPRPGTIRVLYGRPILPADAAAIGVDELTRQTYEELLRLQRSIRHNRPLDLRARQSGVPQ
jgi:1-acyl-sn-glycerol-3-phosphate acyltransferase